MRTLLDTTYLLPAIGVSIKGAPRDAVDRLIARSDEILISEASLFELAAKGARYVLDGELPPGRVTRGISAISHDGSITKLPSYDTPTLRLAFELRRLLHDFIDCLILSSAANHGEILVTEDEEIHRLKEDRGFQELMAAAGSTCKIKRLAEVLRGVEGPMPTRRKDSAKDLLRKVRNSHVDLGEYIDYRFAPHRLGDEDDKTVTEKELHEYER